MHEEVNHIHVVLVQVETRRISLCGGDNLLAFARKLSIWKKHNQQN